MGRMTWAVALSSDRSALALEMQEDGKPLAHMIMDGATTEQLIRDLAKGRAHLTEAVSSALDPGARLEVEAGPAWRVPDTHSGRAGHLLLALRHPGLGWLGFLLDEARAREIGKALSETPPKSGQ